MTEKVKVLWQPNQDIIRNSNILRFVNWLGEVFDLKFEISIDDPLRNVGNYDRLWRWSVENLENFWVSVWQYFGVISH
ncbi:MAG: acetoacetate--CoA ligase, partial [Vulcanisaeta sp.]